NTAMSSSNINNNQNQSGIRVSIDQSRARQTPKTDFGSVMKTGISRGTDAVLSAGQLAAPYIPGGAVLSAAITGVGTLKSSSSAQTAAESGGANSTNLNLTGATGGATSPAMAGGGGAMDAINQRAVAGDSQAQM